MKFTDALIAGGLGAASGYFGAKAGQAENKRKQDEMARQQELLMIKEQNKQRAQYEREKMLKQMQIDADLEKENRKNKREDETTLSSNKFELDKMKTEYGYKKELKEIENKGKVDKNAYTQKDRDKASIAIDKGYDEYINDPFTENPMPKKDWAQKNAPTQYRIMTGGDNVSTSSGNSGSDLQSLIAKVKKGANDTKKPDETVYQPAPIADVDEQGNITREEEQKSVANGLDMMASGDADLSGKTLKNGENSVINKDKITTALDKKIKSKPASIDIGKVLGLFAKGLVNVAGLSIDAVMALKKSLDEAKDKRSVSPEEYEVFNSELDAAMAKAGGAIKPTPYKERVAQINASKTK